MVRCVTAHISAIALVCSCATPPGNMSMPDTPSPAVRNLLKNAVNHYSMFWAHDSPIEGLMVLSIVNPEVERSLKDVTAPKSMFNAYTTVFEELKKQSKDMNLKLRRETIYEFRFLELALTTPPNISRLTAEQTACILIRSTEAIDYLDRNEFDGFEGRAEIEVWTAAQLLTQLGDADIKDFAAQQPDEYERFQRTSRLLPPVLLEELTLIVKTSSKSYSTNCF